MVMFYGYCLLACELDKYSKANTFVMKEKKIFKKSVAELLSRLRQAGNFSTCDHIGHATLESETL